MEPLPNEAAARNVPLLAERVAEAISQLTSVRPCPRPVAGGVVVNPEGQVLMVYSSYAGQGWHFPKGGLDEGETLLEGAMREAEEEGGVLVRAVPSLEPFHLGAGSASFTEPLAWGSPRRHNKRGKINQGAADLLRDAAKLAGLGDAEFPLLKDTLFDLLGEQVIVRWQSVVTYFVLAYAGNSQNKDSESEQVRWVCLEKIRELSRLNSHVGRLLERVGFENAIKQAAGWATPQ
jgi:8-oxo-dGTP pyrophosphatase MutT (NUDIX family)